MATTRIIPMHLNLGKTVAQCLTDRTEYAKNPEKTNDGELISTYACDVKTVDAEFLYAKRQYFVFTGRAQQSDVLAYQIRQAFKPGEVSPDEANQIGNELAMRFLKGKHAFIVATHCDKHHIHNHIIFNSTALDCRSKFRDFLGSGKAVANLSDIICLEHSLSVIENPKRGNHSYNKWLGSNSKPSHRELLRAAIDEALAKKPVDFEAFLRMIADAGYDIRRGECISFRSASQKQGTRLWSLGEGYAEEDLHAAIAGTRVHTPYMKRVYAVSRKDSLLIDIEAKMQAGKGEGYQRWAKVFNLKQMAQTYNYLQEHGYTSYDMLEKATADATEHFHTLAADIRKLERKMAEIASLRTHIFNYAKTRKVYEAYREAGYSAKYLAEHEGEILLHQAAKRAFDELGASQIPAIQRLQQEYATLLSQKKDIFIAYRKTREEMKALLIHKANVHKILIAKEDLTHDVER